ncbi:Centromere protein mis12 [Psilocybe cubensis]|uniref:Centromere protein mis12 n=2 Tax=Psilocybe cubensis TaxID=181762 RepID=A0ACB8GXN6_PSICU|nr:Centromere protein mis12 [Psilocybe cubensis]KAH9480239.1 Centromere protein mis12 [Psilocybe cubensis]
MASSQAGPSNTKPTSVSTPQNAPSLLLSEALGFSPQLLLDDIINIANNAVQDGVNGMEEFLEKWADERVAASEAASGSGANARAKADADAEATIHEVEQGLVAFQTLLEYHTDIAFDFFEAWCMRNIFMVPSDLPIVLPHQQGLDLTVTPEQEVEAMEEVEELRKRLDGQRKLNRLLTRAIRTSSRQLARAESRLSQLSSLSVPSTFDDPGSSSLDKLHSIPPKFLQMYTTMSSLPPTDTITPPTSSAGTTTEVGKRQWETSHTGYVNWALSRLVSRTARSGTSTVDGGGGGASTVAVDRLDAMASEIGTGDSLRRALEAVGNVDQALSQVEQREQQQRQQQLSPKDDDEDDDRMQE